MIPKNPCAFCGDQNPPMKSKQPTPAKPVIRYGIVDKKGHLITGLHSRKHPLEVLLEHSITPGDRIAEFECTEKAK